MKCCLCSPRRELKESIFYADDEIKYAKEEFSSLTRVNERREFNLISHNRTYNLVRTDMVAGLSESFARVLLRFNLKVF